MKIAILGTVGVPGRYGGFETLAENLVHYHKLTRQVTPLTVWCSSQSKRDRPAAFESASLRYISLSANGMQSILYDMVSLLDAIRTGHDRIILLGVSGALFLPLVRIFSRATIIANIDGIEWKRAKWNYFAQTFLRMSEWAAIRFSHAVIADNQAISDYVFEEFGKKAVVISYGGDHAHTAEPDLESVADLPSQYSFALCRIEPENNVAMILEAWTRLETPLVFVGNWDNSEYGRDLKGRFGKHGHVYLLDPVYEPSALRAIRDRATLYVHGHSAGGTNPSLVEMMQFAVPIIAHGCTFNRHTTEGRALYFENADELTTTVAALTRDEAAEVSSSMNEIAQRRYTWDVIGKAYFDLIEEQDAD